MMMNVSILIKKRIFVLAYLLSVYATFGISLNLAQTNENKVLKKFEEKNFVTRLYSNLVISTKNRSGLIILFALLAVFLFCLILYVLSNKYKYSEIITYSVAAIFFSISNWFGIVFRKSETWDIFLEDKYLIFKNVLNISSWFVFSLIFLLTINAICKSLWSNSTKSRNIIDKGSDNQRKKYILLFFKIFLIIIICWAPYYILFWPGVVHGDVLPQILQYHHLPVHFQGKWVSDGTNIIFTNDHPFFMTVIVGYLFDLGKKLGDIKYGIMIYTSIQACLFACSYSIMLTSLYYFNINKYLVRISFVLYALIPIFPMYAIMISGDSLLALAFINFMIVIFWIYHTNGKVLESKVFLTLVFISIIMMGVVKNQGIYISIVTVIFTVFIFRRYWKQVTVSMILPIIVFYFGYLGLVFQLCHVGNVGKQEALSFFFQQTARYVKYHESEVTEKEKEAIDAVLDYEKIYKNYDIELSDPVKKTFRENVTNTEMKQYFKVWFQMGLKHPAEYLQAFVGNTWKYYCPGNYDANIYYYKLSTLRHYIEERVRVYGDIIPDEFIDSFSYNLTEADLEKREIRYFYVQFSKFIPVVNWMILPGCVTWCIIISGLLTWTKKDYKMLFSFVPAVLIVGVCLLSPKNGNVRYLLPAYTIVPAMIAMSFTGKPKSISLEPQQTNRSDSDNSSA